MSKEGLPLHGVELKEVPPHEGTPSLCSRSCREGRASSGFLSRNGFSRGGADREGLFPEPLGQDPLPSWKATAVTVLCGHPQNGTCTYSRLSSMGTASPGTQPRALLESPHLQGTGQENWRRGCGMMLWPQLSLEESHGV